MSNTAFTIYSQFTRIKLITLFSKKKSARFGSTKPRIHVADCNFLHSWALAPIGLCQSRLVQMPSFIQHMLSMNTHSFSFSRTSSRVHFVDAVRIKLADGGDINNYFFRSNTPVNDTTLAYDDLVVWCFFLYISVVMLTFHW
jgi:hypothetical protein